MHLFAKSKTASLLSFSPVGCSQLPIEVPAKRRCTAWSGRRGSNPRQPAWKAGCHDFAARFLYIGLGGDFNAQIYISYGHGIGRCALVKAGFPYLRAL